MRIGELATKTGTQVETIRYYEREGLLPSPGRSEGNYRQYDDTQVRRLAFIRHCRCLDMSLDEIRLLLQFRDAPGPDCGPVDAVLDEHIAHVGERLRELKELLRELKALRGMCSASSADACGSLAGLEAAALSHDHQPGARGGAHDGRGGGSKPAHGSHRAAKSHSHRRGS